ncbi:universal stress protein [Sphingomonas sp. TX0543]|uniref:universal stress protein n=1 Tax=unclassified Sphingomonas TaxID=196159 RepID=UPI0010F68841|nr:universal stress protein [Sphingomonas sp. 3P27F8]
MKNILLLVHDDAGQEARFQAALDLTRALDGHLDCLDAMPMPVVVGPAGGEGVAVLVEAERAQEAANRSRLEPRLKAEGVSWNWVEALGYLPTCLIDAARTADVIVLNRRLDRPDPTDMRYFASNVLSHTRALVVAVSDSADGFDAAGTALIAWDGSARAMATVQRAVPLLALAGEVRIIQVGQISEEAIPLEDVATYLSRHGIHAGVATVADEGSIAVTIRLAAEKFGARYLVMGAYSHHPLREALFGGVTRAMLSACSLPMVLGH